MKRENRNIARDEKKALMVDTDEIEALRTLVKRFERMLTPIFSYHRHQATRSGTFRLEYGGHVIQHAVDAQVLMSIDFADVEANAKHRMAGRLAEMIVEGANEVDATRG